MKKIKHILIIIISIFFSFGCTKKKGCTDIVSISYDPEAEKDDGKCEYGGEGGHNTIILYLHSQGEALTSKPNYLDSAYIKFNAIESGGIEKYTGGDPNSYNKIFTGVTGDSAIFITGLKKGKYFIYVTGVDSVHLLPVNRVTVGFAIILEQDSNIVVYKIGLRPVCCVF